MIRYTLACSSEHTFEAWFRDADTFTDQARSGMLACPICGDLRVDKVMMAPSLGGRGKPDSKEERGTKEGAEPVDRTEGAETDVDRVGRVLRALQAHIEANSTDVGRDFPEEARRIHYGLAEKRSIYGEANLAEARELRDEGVPCLPVPWLSRTGD